MATAYFFGTFNPVHLGHLLVAEAARLQFGFNRVVWVPAATPPHRQNDPELAPFAHRLKMVELACRSNPFFTVSNIEGKRSGPSYTVETLKQMIPGFESRTRPVPVIMGTDALMQLATWHQPRVLAEKVLFLQAPRHEETSLCHEIELDGQRQPLHTQTIRMPLIGISSTLIRERIQQNQSIRYLTPEAVADYIAWNRLYRPV